MYERCSSHRLDLSSAGREVDDGRAVPVDDAVYVSDGA
jgi:hypothetical protein